MTVDAFRHAARSRELADKVARVFQKRAALAQQRYAERTHRAFGEHLAGPGAIPATPWDAWAQWSRYAGDAAERWVLFWDTLRQRGDNFAEQTRAGLPPVLHFDYEVILDARAFRATGQLRAGADLPPAGRDG